ncbi:MAG: TIGR02281 family clan AA aspartic protease [Candidatus Dactylopiibacterium carminicum]|uniref:TIGR02281 family clan AA aspartic protease n=1 Tax=Candidatus Dactylopiibacterium carminicum TaxID=857335 RepID=A0A272EQB2_9RHOO|nr:TIGR02281 family clan AA aspartic protease [Candidatus Dactylopiibacterium carminicum]KAF7598567.1 TIGR02281 family clan AA aspartic protease [Candidatus Dactylopiibacterium carminicum]PAS92299.1 MAG: TIGR02281 family clan AA aspartic protease [Candidatus Dactylopiibacterium carminicum]PAS92711.1 MAG: TIGR02281 family clan AA aspartic protease [Candidatus Dactylopiibacterium carminicum]PAS98228.1 MAG: hypothetical protein BSR46_12480 [Candidatus Dactylopiibacterium carminicum]
MCKGLLRGLTGLILTGFVGLAAAQQVSLTGVMGGKALLVVDGGKPRLVAPGQSAGDVRVVSVAQSSAVIEVAGLRRELHLGETQVSVGPRTGTARQVTLISDARGHFVTSGSINGASVSFLVDTGASSIAMSTGAATRAGIDYRKGEAGLSSTANGVVQTWRVRLSRVTVGDITLYDVDGVVLPADMPYVLLGMSFLNRMEMRRDGSTMVLTQRF